MEFNCSDYWENGVFQIEKLCADATAAYNSGNDVTIWMHPRTGYMVASALTGFREKEPWSDSHTMNPQYYATCMDALNRWKGIYLP